MVEVGWTSRLSAAAFGLQSLLWWMESDMTVEEGDGELQKRIERGTCPRCKTQWQDVLATDEEVTYKCHNCSLVMTEKKPAA